MGVIGLWQLIESAGRPVALETLEGKVLAVDASILLNQAIKGMKDKQGRTINNAHLAVLFHRVCKLLFYRIKPIFVFDGGAPELKRRTLMRRQQRREQAAAEMVKASDNAVRNLLKQRALEEIARSEGVVMPLSSPSILGQGKSQGSARSAALCTAGDMYDLPPLPMDALGSPDDSSEDDEDRNYGPLGDIMHMEDMDDIDMESSEFQSLPLEVQHEILTEVKDVRKSKRRVNWQDLPKSSDDFAQYQMNKLVNHSRLSQKITNLRKEMKSRTAGLMLSCSSASVAGHASGYSACYVDSNRIASEDHSHYILLKGVRSDSVAFSEREILPKAPSRSLGVGHPDVMVGVTASCSRTPWDTTGTCTPSDQKKADEKVQLSTLQLHVSENSDNFEPLDGAIKVHIIASSSMEASEPTAIPKAVVPMGRSHLVASDGSTHSLSTVSSSSESKQARWHLQNPIAMEELPSVAVPEVAGQLSGSEPASIAHTLLGSVGAPSHTLSGSQVSQPATKVTASGTGLSTAPGDDNTADVSIDRSSGLLVSMRDTVSDSRTSSDSSDDEYGFVEVESAVCDNEAVHDDVIGSTEKKEISEPLSCENLKSKPADQPALSGASNWSTTVVDSELPTEAGHTIDESAEWKSLLSAGQSAPQHSPSSFTELSAYALSQEDVHRLELALETERSKLTKEQRKQEASALTLTEQMVQEAQELLKLFGVPYIISPSEAEAQCAMLEELGLCHGIVTDDSDVWLFGGHMVYKNFFKQDKFVEFYKANDIEHLFGLNRSKLIALALVSGSDYTDGIDGAGPVTAMEILSEFSVHGDGISCLKAFSQWWMSAKSSAICADTTPKRQRLLRLSIPEGFPDNHISDAYLKPVVDDSKEDFTWANPELHLLRTFASERLGWQQKKADDILLPVLQRLNQRQSQRRIDSFFVAGCDHSQPASISYVDDKFRSKRVKKAASVLLGKHTEINSQNGAPLEDVARANHTVAEAGSRTTSQKNLKTKKVHAGKGRTSNKKKNEHAAEDCDGFSEDGDELIMNAAVAFEGTAASDCCSAAIGSSSGRPKRAKARGRNETGVVQSRAQSQGEVAVPVKEPLTPKESAAIAVGCHQNSRNSMLSRSSKKRCRDQRKSTVGYKDGRCILTAVELSATSSDSD